MTRDRSLEEFVGAADQGDSDPDHSGAGANEPRDAGDTEGVDDGAEEEGTEEVGDDSYQEDERVTPTDPMPATYSAREGACGACGARVETRWRSEGSLVCTDCKDW